MSRAKGFKHSEETKKRMSKVAKQKGFGKWSKDRKHSKETRKKISESNIGKKYSKETRFKMSISAKKRIQYGKESPFWTGGIKIEKGDYISLYRPEHPKCINDKYVLRSHLVMEQIIGRYLKSQEIVHHKGIHFPIKSIENRQDDSPENLQLCANTSEHRKLHNYSKKS